ncbi:hypothetical protein [Rhodopseudomonas telluris]|uniref:Uncharacterized protein n=1 Tax=Rhodopseudomonas telluris TaxID=644215 RepID=A0ABV6ETN2_9BRAD
MRGAVAALFFLDDPPLRPDDFVLAFLAEEVLADLRFDDLALEALALDDFDFEALDFEDLDDFDFDATAMLSTRFGYGRPARLARALAAAFLAGDRCFEALPVRLRGFARDHGAFLVAAFAFVFAPEDFDADVFVDLAMPHQRQKSRAVSR